MIELVIPGRGSYTFEYLFLDVNGTLATGGVLVEGVAERLRQLSGMLEVVMLTADTHGKQAEIDHMLGLQARRVEPGQEREQKTKAVMQYGADYCIAIGNGGNDVGMLETAAIGIAVIGGEGASIEAVQAADIVVISINDALDLLIEPLRLAATLRR